MTKCHDSSTPSKLEELEEKCEELVEDVNKYVDDDEGDNDDEDGDKWNVGVLREKAATTNNSDSVKISCTTLKFGEMTFLFSTFLI